MRNELGRYLEPCVEHLLDFCDEVRVLDDFSDDGSWEWLLNRHGVQPLRLDNVGFFAHEGAARQALLEWTLEGSPTHVLAVDADEFVSDGDAVRHACATGTPVLSLAMLEVWKAFDECLCVRGDGGWHPHAVHALWQVSASAAALRIADRALACGRVPTLIDQAPAMPSGASIFHFGWANASERVARHHRYAVADGGRFHRSQHLDSILWPDEQVAMHPFEWPPALDSYRGRILDRATVKEPAWQA